MDRIKTADALALLTKRVSDVTSGENAVARDWSRYWNACIGEARTRRAELMKTWMGQFENVRRASEVRSSYGVSELAIPPPP